GRTESVPAPKDWVPQFDPLTGQQLNLPPGHRIHVTLRAMFRSLDPHSGVLSPDEQRRNIALDQEASGVGVVLHDYSGVGPLVVRHVYPGSPAQRAGLRPGDHILRVNDTVLEKPDAEAVAAARALLEKVDGDGITINGPASVTLAFRRPGGAVRTA